MRVLGSIVSKRPKSSTRSKYHLNNSKSIDFAFLESFLLVLLSSFKSGFARTCNLYADTIVYTREKKKKKKKSIQFQSPTQFFRSVPSSLHLGLCPSLI